MFEGSAGLFDGLELGVKLGLGDGEGGLVHGLGKCGWCGCLLYSCRSEG